VLTLFQYDPHKTLTQTVQCRVDPLLDNDNKTTYGNKQQILNKQIYAAVTEQRLRKQTCSHGNNWSTAMDGVIYAVYVEMLYGGQLELSVQRVVRESVKRRLNRFLLCDPSLLTKEHGLVVFKKNVQRRFFEPKKEHVIRVSRILHREKLHNLYPLPSFILLRRLNKS
jgi:hypothetical protein